MNNFQNPPLIDLLRLMERLRSYRTRKMFTSEQTTMFYEILTYLINQLEFPLWSDRFKVNGLDNYFFRTIGIVITPDKQTTLATIHALQTDAQELNVLLKMRGLETLINEVVVVLSKKQIKELNVRLESLLKHTGFTK